MLRTLFTLAGALAAAWMLVGCSGGPGDFRDPPPVPELGPTIFSGLS